MDSARCSLRRATLDDLEGLKELWGRCHLQVLDLERHLTDFQMVVTLEGDLLAAVGFRIDGGQALVHSEAFAQVGGEDELRELLWKRLGNWAQNHGLVRMWTLAGAPFWVEQADFRDAGEGDLKRLPVSFGDAGLGWKTRVLREENARAMSLEQELKIFQQQSRADMHSVMSQAQMIKGMAYGIAGMILVGVVALGAYLGLRWFQGARGGGGRRRRL